MQSRSTSWLQRPDVKHVLVLSIFLDLLSVSLVVPALPGRYRELGLTGWRFGAMGSVYSATQILGGVVLGFASDGALGRRGLLLLSFAGAALSYALVATARSLTTLVISRVIVGLTKQSVTAVSALMADATSVSERTAWLAQITCATTLSWAVGSALGGLLSTISPVLPEIVAVLLYGVNTLLVLGALPLGAIGSNGARRTSSSGQEATSREHEQPDATTAAARAGVPVGAKPPPVNRLASSFALVLRDGAVLRVLSVQLTRVLMVKALGSASEMYEVDRWSLSTVENGLLRSYKSVAVLGVQVLIMPLLLSRQFGLHSLLHVTTALKVAIDLLEFVPSAMLGLVGALPLLPAKLALHPSLLVYALVCVPARAICANAISVSQKSLFTMSVSQSEMGAALAVLDVLQSCVGVVAPLLGGAMLGTVPVAYQPLVAAACNALLAVQLMVVYPPPGWLRRIAPLRRAGLAVGKWKAGDEKEGAGPADGRLCAADGNAPPASSLRNRAREQGAARGSKASHYSE